MTFFWRWKHFKPSEVLSPAGLWQYERENLMIQPYALDKLHNFRVKVGEPLLINHSGLNLRGYRSIIENNSVPGCTQFSRHVQGIAFDISPTKKSLEELYTEAKRFGFGGLGFYKRQNFIHIDCRPVLNDKPIEWSG